MTGNASDVANAFANAADRRLSADLAKIQHCLDQLDEEQVWWRPHPAMNSIGNLLLHLVGNIKQWIVSGVGGVDFVRDRPREFSEPGPIAKAELMNSLREAIDEANRVVRAASVDELLAQRSIQGFDETGLSAAFESIAHLQGHTQEIICLTRTQLGDDYRFKWQPTNAEEGAAE